MRAGLHDIAARVIRAQDEGLSLQPFSLSGFKLSIHEAYEVSWLVHDARLAAGWTPIGRKIGFTNRDMWTLFGVTQPVWAFVYDQTCEEVSNRSRCSLTKWVQPKIEPELVFRLRAVPSRSASEDEILGCIDWMAHGLEMVHCHYPGWQFSAADAICDSSFHARLFVGPKIAIGEGARELVKRCEVTLYRGAELMEVGRGQNVLGSPLLAIASLLEAIHREGSIHPLMPGEIITTGTITAAYSVSAGEQWHTRFAGEEFPGLSIDFI